MRTGGISVLLFFFPGKRFPPRGTRGGRGRGARGRGRGGGRIGAGTTNVQDNPFFAAKQDRPVVGSGLTGEASQGGGATGIGASRTTQPPTYAAVVSRTRQQQQQGNVPVPSFITHGPDSIPPLTSGVADVETMDNPFLKSLQRSQQTTGVPRPPPPPYQPPHSGGHSSQPAGEEVGGQPVPQMPLNIGGLFHSSASFSPTGVPTSPPRPLPSGMLNFPIQQSESPFISAADSHAIPKPHPQLHPQLHPMSQPLPHPDNTALHVKGIPDELNNQPFLGKHFSRFGKVTKLNCYPNKRFATVVYALKVSMSSEHLVLVKYMSKIQCWIPINAYLKNLYACTLVCISPTPASVVTTAPTFPLKGPFPP